MKRFVCVFVVLCMICVVTASAYAEQWKMQKRIDNATGIIHEFLSMPEDSIPAYVMENCKGLAIISIIKGGFIVGVRGGGGVVIAKDQAGKWTAPSAVGIGGASIGFQIGAQQIDLVLVLNTDAAVEAFSKTNCTLGADAAVAAGPVGRAAEADLTMVSAVYAYSRTKGLFAGVSLEGSVIDENQSINEGFYGRAITGGEILSGSVPQPETASRLYEALK